jgi:hypothetical protein
MGRPTAFCRDHDKGAGDNWDGGPVGGERFDAALGLGADGDVVHPSGVREPDSGGVGTIFKLDDHL